MAWWTRSKDEKKKTKAPAKKRSVPTGLFSKCDECGKVLQSDQVRQQLWCCPECGFHFVMPTEARMRAMVDEGSFVEEDANLTPVDPLSFVDSKRYSDRLKSAQKTVGVPDAFRWGVATLEGQRACVGFFVFEFMGGSMGSVVGEKIARLYERAAELGHPAIIFSASGGARMQEGILSLMQMAKTTAALARLREAGLLYVSVLLHPTTGGVAASFASLGDVILAEPRALIGFAGPRVIEQTIRQKLPEGFQRSEFLLEHGMVDAIVERSELRRRLGRLLALPASSSDDPIAAPAMTYAQFLTALSERRRFGMRPGLERMRAALVDLGNPAPPGAVIHIAGSNGKGSTAAMCEALVRAKKRRSLLYTSPHLSRFTERIRVDGDEISQGEVAAIGERVLAAGPDLTYFEVATAIALVAARDHDTEVAILEVGLGGRLDATNVIDRPSVTVITSISLEHTEVLGGTIAEIAREKAGILKRNVPLVLGALPAEAEAVVRARANELGAPILDHVHADLPSALALTGPHQRSNAALALTACAVLFGELAASSDPAALVSGGGLRWPGRLEPIAPGVWLDAAHNPEGARALALAIPEIARGLPVALVFGVADDKDARAMLATLAPEVAHVLLTRPKTPRALDPTVLARDSAGAIVVDDPVCALAEARRLAPIVVIAGSIFLVGAVRAALSGESIDPISVQDPAPSSQNRSA